LAAKVLIIEDDPGIRLLFSAILLRHGYAVMQAEDAPTGIDLAKTSRPDIILMDIQLPGMDGLQATTVIHQQPGLEAVPIVAITGHVTVEHRRRASEAGCIEFLGKPVLANQLMATINNILHPSADLPEPPP
jgi:two-component system, cell cycle response regulator DivK